MYRILFIFLFINNAVLSQNADFNFAFLTDIHLNNKAEDCFLGFETAVKHAKNNGSHFLITGGDNVDIDVLGNKQDEAEELYKKLKNTMNKVDIDIYPTIGNHDRFMDLDKNSEYFNEGMFEKYITKSYYSFDYKDWHFIVLNSAQTCKGKYCIDQQQILWLNKDLQKLSPETPIVVSAHIPFLSVYYPALEGKYKATDTFSNFKEVWDMFENYNLKLVLQGHMHLYEEIKVKDVQFITGGAVSASWWGGPYHGTEEGYLLVKVQGDSFAWEYIDYGWEAK